MIERFVKVYSVRLAPCEHSCLLTYLLIMYNTTANSKATTASRKHTCQLDREMLDGVRAIQAMPSRATRWCRNTKEAVADLG